MLLTPEQIRAYFERRHPDQRITLGGRVAVRCVFHFDDNPSCTLFLDGNGGFNCHACGAKGNVFQFEARFFSCSLTQAEINVAEITGATLEAHRNGRTNLGSPVAIYDYRDESGITLFQKRRYEPETGKKTFRIFHPTDKGWKPGIDTRGEGKTGRILYNLPNLVTANLVFFCEGEKDCQSVMDANLFAKNGFSVAATTTFDGAWQRGQSPKWQDSYDANFAGKQVVIFADNDEPGRIYAETAAAAISKYAHGVRVISFPELHEGGDVSDFLTAGRTIQELEKRVQDAPKWIPPAQTSIGHTPGIPAPDLVCLADVKALPVHWLWKGYLPCGMLAMLSGDPAAGKTFIALAIAADLSNGRVPVTGDPCEGNNILDKMTTWIVGYFESLRRITPYISDTTPITISIWLF